MPAFCAAIQPQISFGDSKAGNLLGCRTGSFASFGSILLWVEFPKGIKFNL
jgi:hypothetical protein